MRLAVARSVTRSKQAIPHFYVNAAVDMTAALLERERLKAEGIAEVSVTAWVVKAAALALKAFPAVNSRVEGERLVVFEDVNIGIAVGTDEGLIVPVLPRADTLGLVDLARRSEALIAAARAGRQVSFDPGTFTVSNLGMFGIDSFTAIINPPEAAILAVGAVSRRPAAAAGGGIELRDLMQITLSVDHRIIDGALAARFINHVKHGLENPGTLIGPS
jgi:pyruvate dehydrogenase E2 component (dihydrolipoamide acetyltransferase)